MKRLISTGIVIVVFMLISACSTTGGTKIHFNTKDYNTDTLKIQAQYPTITGFSDKSFEKEINESYETKIQGWIEGFKKECADNVQDTDSQIGEFSLKNTVKQNKPTIISIVSEVYSFTGGAHGATLWSAKNIDVMQNKEIHLSDLFKEGIDYKDIINKIMLRIIEENPKDYSDLWEKPILTQKQECDFYIENGKVVIYYHPYELSYYARGFVEFPIKLDEIRPYLGDNYKGLE